MVGEGLCRELRLLRRFYAGSDGVVVWWKMERGASRSGGTFELMTLKQPKND